MITIKQIQGRGLGQKIVGVDLSPGLKTTLREWLELTRDQIKSEKLSGHPLGVQTGELRAGIKAQKPTGTRRIKGTVTSDAEYGPFYEYGRSQRWNKPFMRPIFFRNQGKLVDNLTKSIGDTLP